MEDLVAFLDLNGLWPTFVVGLWLWATLVEGIFGRKGRDARVN